MFASGEPDLVKRVTATSTTVWSRCAADNRQPNCRRADYIHSSLCAASKDILAPTDYWLERMPSRGHEPVSLGNALHPYMCMCVCVYEFMEPFTMSNSMTINRDADVVLSPTITTSLLSKDLDLWLLLFCLYVCPSVTWHLFSFGSLSCGWFSWL